MATVTRNIFAVVFGSAALEGAAIAALFDQVSHGTVGASSMFAKLMAARGLPCLSAKGEAMVNPSKVRWLATLGAIVPKGNGRETRATLPVFARAIEALMAGDRTLADSFDADEAAAWSTYSEALKASREAAKLAASLAAAVNPATVAALSAEGAPLGVVSTVQDEAPSTVQDEAPSTVQGETPAAVQGEAPSTVQGEAPSTVQGDAFDAALTLLEGGIRSHTLSPSQAARMVALVSMLQPATA